MRPPLQLDGMRRPVRWSRRSFVRVGSLFPLGIGLGWGASNRGLGEETTPVGTARSCILLWLDGGPSHLEMWDPKIDAPAEVRGPFGAIATRLPGVSFSEGLSRCARLADRMTIVRSLTSPLGEHGLANQYLLTGYPPSPAMRYPSLGSLVAQDRSAAARTLPPYISIPEARNGMGAGALGGHAEPFSLLGDPGKSDFRVRDLEAFPGLDSQRLARRHEFLAELEAGTSSLQPAADWERAMQMSTSPEWRRAFDLNDESPASRERYGPRSFGQGCLLARRLVERGVSFVTVVQPGWDTHENLTLQLRDGYAGAKVGVGLIPTFDQAASALIEDLEERGMLEDTLVVAMGEFGRTPKLNPRGGRDHWPRVFSAMLCGGGLPRGLVLGASDRVGESPKERPVTPADLIWTLGARLGLDPRAHWTTRDGRPIAVNRDGRGIDELL